jgi:hypothetical protein
VFFFCDNKRRDQKFRSKAKTIISAKQYSVVAFTDGRRKLFLVKYSRNKTEKTACPNRTLPSFQLLFIVAAIEIRSKDNFFSERHIFLFSFGFQKRASEP